MFLFQYYLNCILKQTVFCRISNTLAVRQLTVPVGSVLHDLISTNGFLQMSVDSSGRPSID